MTDLFEDEPTTILRIGAHRAELIAEVELRSTSTPTRHRQDDDPVNPYYREPLGPIALYAGDALAVLAQLDTAAVDAIITDPPYSSGGMTRGDRTAATTTKYVSSGQPRAEFAGDNRDQRAYGYWCALWLSEALRATRPGGICAHFADWRQLPTTTDALQAGGWVWRSGTTGVAAVLEGRGFTGAEIDPHHQTTAQRRIHAATMQGALL